MVRKSRWPRNMYQVTMLVLLLYRLIGLATFSINKQTTVKKKCSKSVLLFTGTKLGILYNLLLSCSIIASNYITIPALYRSEYAYQTVITVFIEIFQSVLGSFVIFFILLLYCTNQSAVIRIGNDLVHMESTLRRLQQPSNYKHVYSILLVVHIFKLSLMVALFVTDHMAFHSNPISWLANIVPATFVGFIYIQYFSVLSLMDVSFVNINNTIQGLCRSWSDDTCVNSLYQTRRVFVSSSTIQFIVQIRGIHNHLCNISSAISQFYSMPILIGVFFTFFTLLYNTYYFFEPIMVENEYLNCIIFINTLLWIIFLLYSFGLLTTKITKITNEIEKTGNVVHALLNRIIDQETKRELKQFSLQLLHQKVKFTANGYFTLDNTFFQLMLGTVTTYMVILIQFQVGTSVPNVQSCNCTH